MQGYYCWKCHVVSKSWVLEDENKELWVTAVFKKRFFKKNPSRFMMHMNHESSRSPEFPLCQHRPLQSTIISVFHILLSQVSVWVYCLIAISSWSLVGSSQICSSRAHISPQKQCLFFSSQSPCLQKLVVGQMLNIWSSLAEKQIKKCGWIGHQIFSMIYNMKIFISFLFNDWLTVLAYLFLFVC